MIFIADITEKTGDVFKNIGSHVINTDRIGRYKGVNGSSSSFLYTDNPKDRRRSPMPTKASVTPAEIQTQMDSVLLSNSMTLSVFLDNDISKPTFDVYVKYADFIYAFPHRLNSNYSWVTFVVGFSITKSLVDASLAELVHDASGGTTTTAAPTTPSSWSDGDSSFRLDVRDGALYLDEYVGGIWTGVNNWSLP